MDRWMDGWMDGLMDGWFVNRKVIDRYKMDDKQWHTYFFFSSMKIQQYTGQPEQPFMFLLLFQFL